MEKRNNQIEGLRAIMCILIALYHLVYRYQQLYGSPENYALIQYWGRFGVAVFFLISTFFMYSPSNSNTKILDFYKKRLLRLWPAYFISISITFCALHIIPLPGRQVSFPHYLANTVFLNGFVGIPYVDGAHWFITDLLSIIFVVGLIYHFKLHDSSFIYFAWIGFGLLCYYTPLKPILRLMGGSYFSLAVAGIMIRRIVEKKMIRQSIVLLAFAIVSSVSQGLSTLIINCIACALFYFVARGKVRIIENAGLVFIGRISYPVYLVHQNIGMTVEYSLTTFRGRFHWTYVVCAFLVVFLLGWLVYIMDDIIHHKIINHK